MTTKAAPSTNLVTIDPDAYAITEFDTATIGDILRDNLGGQGLTPWDLDRIAMPTGGATQWQVPGPEKITSEDVIDGVIVQVHGIRTYWASQDANGAPPDCSSQDMLYGRGLYGRGSEENPTGLCEDCPMSRWGSGKDGRGQACKQRAELYVVRAQDNLPIVITASPTSLKPIRRYMVQLASRGRRYSAVITRLRLEATANQRGQRYSQIIPTMIRPLTAEQAPKFSAYADALKGAFGAAPVDPDQIEMDIE